MSGWRAKRKKPYTAKGITRLPCIRCGSPAAHQWQICADGNNFRAICLPCDIALNKMVLKWMRHPDAQSLGERYERSALKADGA